MNSFEYQIYHLHAHTIRLLDETDATVAVRERSHLPGNATASSSNVHHAGASKIGDFHVLGKRNR
jgi:hypothetical protein